MGSNSGEVGASSGGFSFSSSLGLEGGSHSSGMSKLFGSNSSHSFLVSNSFKMSSTFLGSKSFSFGNSDGFHTSGMSESLEVSSMGSSGLGFGNSQGSGLGESSSSLLAEGGHPVVATRTVP